MVGRRATILPIRAIFGVSRHIRPKRAEIKRPATNAHRRKGLPTGDEVRALCWEWRSRGADGLAREQKMSTLDPAAQPKPFKAVAVAVANELRAQTRLRCRISGCFAGAGSSRDGARWPTYGELMEWADG